MISYVIQVSLSQAIELYQSQIKAYLMIVILYGFNIGIKLNTGGVVHMPTTSRGIMGLGTDDTGKQIQLMKQEQELCASSKVAEVPFEFPLIANSNQVS
jgi:hypothetical protein